LPPPKELDMSNKCGFCETKTETDMLVLGDQWLEFCSPCGEKETLTNRETGEVATIKAVFDKTEDGTSDKAVATKTKVTTTMMETTNGETWHEKSIEVSLTACSSCGLLWDRKWQAESCEKRGHVESFPQHYGGYVENGVYKPANTYIRKSYGRN